MLENLTAEKLRDILHYDQLSGRFTWKVDASSRVKAGSPAGGRRKDGYWRVKIQQKPYFAHRLAWLHAYGVWPSGVIDHIDRNTGNNSLENLRDVSNRVNLLNRRNPGRTPGTTKEVKSGKYKARVWSGGERKQLGLHDTPEEAVQACEKFYNLTEKSLDEMIKEALQLP